MEGDRAWEAEGGLAVESGAVRYFPGGIVGKNPLVDAGGVWFDPWSKENPMLQSI